MRLWTPRGVQPARLNHPTTRGGPTHNYRSGRTSIWSKTSSAPLARNERTHMAETTDPWRQVPRVVDSIYRRATGYRPPFAIRRTPEPRRQSRGKRASAGEVLAVSWQAIGLKQRSRRPSSKLSQRASSGSSDNPASGSSIHDMRKSEPGDFSLTSLLLWSGTGTALSRVEDRPVLPPYSGGSHVWLSVGRGWSPALAGDDAGISLRPSAQEQRDALSR
jgi:hypothetical protein